MPDIAPISSQLAAALGVPPGRQYFRVYYDFGDIGSVDSIDPIWRPFSLELIGSPLDPPLASSPWDADEASAGHYEQTADGDRRRTSPRIWTPPAGPEVELWGKSLRPLVLEVSLVIVRRLRTAAWLEWRWDAALDSVSYDRQGPPASRRMEQALRMGWQLVFDVTSRSPGRPYGTRTFGHEFEDELEKALRDYPEMHPRLPLLQDLVAEDLFLADPSVLRDNLESRDISWSNDIITGAFLRGRKYPRFVRGD